MLSFSVVPCFPKIFYCRHMPCPMYMYNNGIGVCGTTPAMVLPWPPYHMSPSVERKYRSDYYWDPCFRRTLFLSIDDPAMLCSTPHHQPAVTSPWAPSTLPWHVPWRVAPPCNILWARHGLLLLRQSSGNKCHVIAQELDNFDVWYAEKYYLHGHSSHQGTSVQGFESAA